MTYFEKLLIFKISEREKESIMLYFILYYLVNILNNEIN